MRANPAACAPPIHHPTRVIPAHFDLAWRSRQLCTLPDVTAEPELDESQSDQWHLQAQADMEETVNEPVG